MKMSNLRMFKIGFALLVYLLTMTGAGNLVLCFGEDGHVSFELSSTGGCATTAEAVGDHCGPCVDFPLLVGASDQQCATIKVSFSRETISDASQTPFIGVEPEADKWQPLRPSSDLFPDTILASLRTVVLVI
jgi:hypothetical protein